MGLTRVCLHQKLDVPMLLWKLKDGLNVVGSEKGLHVLRNCGIMNMNLMIIYRLYHIGYKWPEHRLVKEVLIILRINCRLPHADCLYPFRVGNNMITLQTKKENFRQVLDFPKSAGIWWLNRDLKS